MATDKVARSDALRLSNLRVLVDRFKSQASAAKAMGIDAPALSRILSGTDSIGWNRARSIETSLDLPAGWLEEDHARHRVEWSMFAAARGAAGDTIEAAASWSDRMMDELRARFD